MYHEISEKTAKKFHSLQGKKLFYIKKASCAYFVASGSKSLYYYVIGARLIRCVKLNGSSPIVVCNDIRIPVKSVPEIRDPALLH